MRRLWLIVLAVLLWLPQWAAHAEEGTNEIGKCLSDGKVWLFVITDEDTVLANQCVDNPKTGEEALHNSKITLGMDDKGFICQMGGHPAECPKKFAGQFWNYYHAKPGEAWEFSQKGAKEYQVQPGSIEGWCYNKQNTESCTPPLLRVVVDGKNVVGQGVSEGDLKEFSVKQADAAEAPAADSAPNFLVIVGVFAAVVVVAVIVAYAVMSRRVKNDESGDQVVGGR